MSRLCLDQGASASLETVSCFGRVGKHRFAKRSPPLPSDSLLKMSSNTARTV
ncbi:MAG: hypothetical protein MI923_18060 [Phycisphaerales bacterium]|nr:hypothetical protein [Phycisphaerales bacterium]